MGNFEEHMSYGVAAHVVLSVGLVMIAYSTIVPLTMAVVGVFSLPVTIAGAAFPDIDHPSSKPNRMFRKLLTVAGTIISAYLFGVFGFLPVYEMFQSMEIQAGAMPLTAVCTVLISICGGFGTRTLFDQIRPPHRGMTHRLPTASAVSGGVGVLAWALTAVIGVTTPGTIAIPIGAAFFAGVVSHLACDGVLLDIRTYTQLT